VITALLLAATLHAVPTGTTIPVSGMIRNGAQGEQTCPFPSKLLPYRIKNARTGKLIRSEQALAEFRRCTGFPTGRPGYVIDHIFPLACGGPDVPENMIWQKRVDSLAKDRWERARPGCGTAVPESDLP
jgi:hypothetical protein